MIEHPSLETATSGSIRFNTDSSKLEIYNGEQWFEIDIDHGSGRGLFMGGTPSPDTIDYITIDSTGDAIDFGNLTSGRFTGGAFASQTRALYVAGELAPGAESNIVDYVTISSLGDAVDFGDSAPNHKPRAEPPEPPCVAIPVCTSGEVLSISHHCSPLYISILLESVLNLNDPAGGVSNDGCSILRLILLILHYYQNNHLDNTQLLLSHQNLEHFLQTL